MSQACSPSAARKLSAVSTRFQAGSNPLRASLLTRSNASSSESSTIRTRMGLLIKLLSNVVPSSSRATANTTEAGTQVNRDANEHRHAAPSRRQMENTQGAHTTQGKAGRFAFSGDSFASAQTQPRNCSLGMSLTYLLM